MLNYLIRQSWRLLLLAATASVTRGICAVLTVIQINAALSADAATRAQAAWWFGGTVLLLMASHMLSNISFERLNQRAQADMRRYISAKVIGADYRHIEKTGPARIQSALTEHSAKVAEFFVGMPAILTNSVVVIGCLVYMVLLSWQVFLVAIAVLALGSLGYHLAHLKAIRYLERAAREQDVMFGHFQAMTGGAKELRLHARKRQLFERDLLHVAIENVRRLRTTGMSIFTASAGWGNFLIFAFIGLVLFFLVGDAPAQRPVMSGFALVFVYIVTPLEVLLMNIPRANLARVAAARIDAVTRDMASSEPPAPPGQRSRLDSLALQGVTHRYYHERSDGLFLLGPVQLDFKPGEIIFLVGGNGSGKTTLAKLLVGLYVPQEGAIVWNGQPVTDASRDAYRQLFSTVFSDFHLFDRLLENDRPDLDQQANRLLERLQLQHVVQVRQGAFTTRALSQGQRKRLALVVAALEDRPFMVFDEWAADQDPLFKDVFYRSILPELKAQGKTVLVISHDDRYFDLADVLLSLENGQLSTRRPVLPAQDHQRHGGVTDEVELTAPIAH
ncbi:cyclic peptide export ABC transporter [Herbaspirillum sp. YR522]|uniref:cyclic peptide export ABC transporter n=1 Tax=Herbaspirillum sp. YR522 TaxID=1144342 RepID=UPI00026FC53B|nr:cyclic peptide export ABC transporter [Herbaspirillum sp. YR522]EJM97627.1 cyclic peptide transporter [Herbaspirillum sp. YR522]